MADLRSAITYKLAGPEAAAAQATDSDPILQEAAAVLKASGFPIAGMTHGCTSFWCSELMSRLQE